MATAGLPLWSTTAASNGTADPAVNFAEGMAPSAVNDSARALMASVAKWRDDLQGITTGGTSTAFTLATNSTFATAAVMSGFVFTILPHTDSGAAPTLAVDGLTARALNFSTGVAVPTGYFKSGTPYRVKYVHASTEFIVVNAQGVLPASHVTTAAIADNAVTLAKLATQSDQTILGNVSGGAAVPSAITIGAGLTGSSGTLKSAFPPPAAFKNLSIKVASNTTVTVAADFVTTTNGTTYQTTAVSSTVNLGTSVAVDALDTGTIAIDSWYFIWVIAKSDGTTKVIASLQSTASATFLTNLAAIASGAYTFYARVGAVQTIHGSATLYGTWQIGRKAQYVVGLAQTSVTPIMASGAIGTFSTGPRDAIALARYVPSTASAITVTGAATGNTTGVGIAPNASYGGNTSTTNIAPLLILLPTSGYGGVTLSQQITMLLESTNIYWVSPGSGLVAMNGWEDNI